MKPFVLALKIISAFIIILCINLNPGCKDPHEYAPPEDSLIPPPEPPQPIYPPDDTGYVFGQGGQGWDFVIVLFEWTPLNGVEYYYLEIAAESTFANPQMHTTLNTTIILYFDVPRKCFWRVRGSSPYWTWYTNWSEVRYFRIWWPIE
ncbi:hypothetical protein KAX97_04435 [candidate division WOR-3 bacterium]|nr:hypothetical protein [candidate division WOR-3 bacterium]